MFTSTNVLFLSLSILVFISPLLHSQLDRADDYDERAKIRSALRTLKKSTGHGNRRTTGTSVYRRPGFQAPKSVLIPNSVTGNVLPSTVKDGESVKPPDKNTPTIGYLNATTTVKSPRRTAGKHSSSSQSSYVQQDNMKEQETWWTKSQSSSRSQTPSDTLDQQQVSLWTDTQLSAIVFYWVVEWSSVVMSQQLVLYEC